MMIFFINSFLLYFFSMALDAPVRFALQGIGLSWALYFRDILIMIGIIYCFFYRTTISYIFYAMLLVFFMLIGYWYTENFYVVFWGLKTIMPFVFGMCIYKFYRQYWLQLNKYMFYIIVISCIGVGLNYFIAEPFWHQINATEIGSTALEGVREWTIYINGVSYRRLSGFTRLANTTSLVILFGLVTMNLHRIRRIVVLLITFPFVFFTTIKVAIFIHLLLLILSLLEFVFSKEMRLKVLKLVCAGVFLIGFFLPLLSLFLNSFINIWENEWLYIIFASTDDRMFNSWPCSLGVVYEYGSLLFGRGLGGLGYGAVLFDTKVHSWTPIDNFFVFWYGNFGILGILFLWYLFYKVLQIKGFNVWSGHILLLFIVFFFYGIMGDMADQISLMELGILTGNLAFYSEKEYEDV